MRRHSVGKIIAASTTVALTLVTLTSIEFLRVVGLLLLYCLSVSAAQADTVASLQGVRPYFYDLDGMLKRRVVRVLVPPSKTMFFLDKGEAYGITVETLREFEKWVNKRHAKKPFYIEVMLIPMHSDKLFEELQAGRGDIAAGNLTVTPEATAAVDFAAPVAEGVKEVLVTGPGAPAVANIDDLGGRKLVVRKSSSYYEHLLGLNDRLQKEGKPTIELKAADAGLEDEDLLEMIGAGLLPWTVVDLHVANVWAKIYKNIIVHSNLVVHDGGQIAWALRKNTPKLTAEVNAFMATHRIGTEFGDGLRSLYYNDGRIVKNALAPEHAKLLRDLMAISRNTATSFASIPTSSRRKASRSPRSIKRSG